ncbi:endothelin-converting enzyme 2-like [Ornithodoros turicata]|uniref:endothelin-converting enzyme 2-like n=1 Tax=Ornithodoros turicata TaxID=34597 RepID=UPI0031398610
MTRPTRERRSTKEKLETKTKCDYMCICRYPLTICAVVCSFALCFLLLYRYLTTEDFAKKRPYIVCSSAACIEYGVLLKASINQSVPPCKDFYTFVCDRWDGAHRTSIRVAHRNRYIQEVAKNARELKAPAQNQSLLQKASRFFQTCENIVLEKKNELAILRNVLEGFNISWPASSSSHGLLKVLGYAETHLNVTPLITFTKKHETGTSSIQIIPSTFIATWSSFRARFESKPAYDQLITAALGLIAGPKPNQSVVDNFRKQEEYIVDILSKIPPYSKSLRMKKSKFVATMNSINVVDWNELFLELFNISKVENVAVELWNTHYFKALNNLVREKGQKLLADFCTWVIYLELGPLFSAEFSELLATEPRSLTSRPERCLSLTEYFMGVALTTMGVYDGLTWSSREDIRRIVKITEQTTGNYVKNMSKVGFNYSQFRAYKRSTSLFGRLASHASVKDAQLLSQGYPDMGDIFVHNYMAAVFSSKMQPPEVLSPDIRYIDRENYYRFFDKATDQFHVWPIAAAVPLYNENATTGLRYGSLGSLVSMGLFEEFYYNNDSMDPKGRAFLRHFNTCVEHAMMYEPGATSLEEIFFLWASYYPLWQAFLSENQLRDRRILGLEEYSEEQTFFIMYCYMHCSGSVNRTSGNCNLPLRSMESFADAFSCPLGSTMNPGGHCSIY